MEKIFARYSYITDSRNRKENSTIFSIAPGYTMTDLRAAIRTADSLSPAEANSVIVTEMEILDDGTIPGTQLVLKGNVEPAGDLITDGAFIGSAINAIIIDGVGAFSQDYTHNSLTGDITPNTPLTWPGNARFTVFYNY